MAKAPAALDCQTWISIFDAALRRPADELNDEWTWILNQLGMAAEQFPAVLKALRQGRWRDAKNPKAYVKTVASREAFKEQLAAEKQDNLVLVPTTADGETASGEGTLDHIAYMWSARDAVRSSDGVWRNGDGAEYDDYEEDDEGNPVESYREHLLAKVPGALKQREAPSEERVQILEWLNEGKTDSYRHASPLVRVDWQQWAEQAGLGEWEGRVLQYRAAGVSRESALAGQPDETARRSLQAAWRQFDRSSKQILKDFAQKNLKRNVPE